jgi:hypothetical protein
MVVPARKTFVNRIGSPLLLSMTVPRTVPEFWACNPRLNPKSRKKMGQKPLEHKTLVTYLIRVKLRQDEGIRANYVAR